MRFRTNSKRLRGMSDKLARRVQKAIDYGSRWTIGKHTSHNRFPSTHLRKLYLQSLRHIHWGISRDQIRILRVTHPPWIRQATPLTDKV
jgi:hypothetical protein